MYICCHVHSEHNPNGVLTILEATDEVFNSFLAVCAKAGSPASTDAVLMNLANGAEVRGSDGSTWFRVEKPICYTPTPTHCQVTGELLGDTMYDGKTRQGPWAIMSPKAWEFYGAGRLGAGFGQRYRRNTEGQFYVTEGMSSRPRRWRTAA